jgi:FkbM family methyltransferase
MPQISTAQVRLATGVTRQIYFRPNTSDEPVIDQILSKSQYDLRRLQRAGHSREPELMRFVQRGIAGGKRPLVIDAGANIGASSVFFATHIASAVVIGIEPEPENFKLLQKIVEGLDVQAVQGALSSARGRARLVDPGVGHWGYRTEATQTSDGNSVPRFTVNDIYQQCDAICFPFIVKVDIEGGEADLFSVNTEWVARTQFSSSNFTTGCYREAPIRARFYGASPNLIAILSITSAKTSIRSRMIWTHLLANGDRPNSWHTAVLARDAAF